MVRRNITQKQLRDSAEKGWLRHFDTFKVSVQDGHAVRLGDVAEVRSGRSLCSEDVVTSIVEHSHKDCELLFGTTRPFGYIPVIIPGSITPWRVSGVKSHLASHVQVGTECQSDTCPGRDRIAVRSLIRPDGRLWASRVNFMAIPRRGVITITPTVIDLYLLLAILNSEAIKRWVMSTQAFMDRWRLQKISITELRALPIPHRVINDLEIDNGKKSLKGKTHPLCSRISRLSKEISNQGSISPQEHRQINHWIEQLYETR